MSQPLQFVAPEDLARANFYGLLARLFHAAPDERLISELRGAAPMEGDGALTAAWRELAAVCASSSPPALENEHTELFVGTGKAEVTPYLSHYLARHSSDNPLVDLRQQLAAWGISRREGVPEYEDHVSAVFEAFRFAIAVQQREQQEQRAFFERFVYPGAMAFCDAVSASRNARFYAPVARFGRAFLDIEQAAFEMAG
jgi:TorA maturation chaperone TorD